jgi:hypothetical protein
LLEHQFKKFADAAVADRDKQWEVQMRKFNDSLVEAYANIAQVTFQRPEGVKVGEWKPYVDKPTVSIPYQKPVQVLDSSKNGSGELTNPERRILNACAWLESIGNRTPKQAAVAFIAGYTVGGGAFNNPRGALRTKGFIDYQGDALVLTDAGRRHAETPDAPLTTTELHTRVLRQLPNPEQRILQPLLTAYPDGIDNDDLARKAGYEPGGGAFNNPRGRLRTLELVTYPERGIVRCSDWLFID